MAMPLATYFTANAVRALPDDGNRYETVHGELLVTPAPRFWHQFVLDRLHRILGGYLTDHGLEALLRSPADISYGPDTLVQPDLFIGDFAAVARSGDWADLRTLYLVIEVISPSSAKSDRFTKRRLYQEQRIPEYWAVDIDQRHVEVWTPDAVFPAIETAQLNWRYPGVDAACVVDLVKVFAEAAG